MIFSMKTAKPCESCGAPKSVFECGICHKAICKSCSEYIDTNSFSFMSKVPAKLTQANYCRACFLDEIVPAQNAYEEMMERAKDVYFLTKAYPGYVRVLRRHTKRVEVKECDDRRETIVRLAFFAAELGYNAIIEAEVDRAKIRMGKYQSSVWSGSAMPANIDGDQLERTSLRRI